MRGGEIADAGAPQSAAASTAIDATAPAARIRRGADPDGTSDLPDHAIEVQEPEQ